MKRKDHTKPCKKGGHIVYDVKPINRDTAIAVGYRRPPRPTSEQIEYVREVREFGPRTAARRLKARQQAALRLRIAQRDATGEPPPHLLTEWRQFKRQHKNDPHICKKWAAHLKKTRSKA